jgi:hypothetical protein
MKVAVDGIRPTLKFDFELDVEESQKEIFEEMMQKCWDIDAGAYFINIIYLFKKQRKLMVFFCVKIYTLDSRPSMTQLSEFLYTLKTELDDSQTQ